MRRAAAALVLLAAGPAAPVASALAAQDAPPPATRADSVLDRAVRLHNGLRSLRATFEQVLTNPLTGSEVSARGELQQMGRRYLSIRFTDPAGDAIVADGQSLWVSLPSALPGQVLRLPLEAAAGAPGLGGVDVLGQFFDAPRSRYRVSDAGRATIDGRATSAVTLVPRGPNGPFAKATVWFDDRTGFTRQFETTDANGVVRRVRMLRFRPGAAPSDGAFRFVPPKGARIVEQPSLP